MDAIPEAKGHIDRLLRIAPEDSSLLLVAADIQMYRGDESAQKKLLEKIISVSDPESDGALHAKSRLCSLRNDVKSAYEILTKLKNRHPDDAYIKNCMLLPAIALRYVNEAQMLLDIQLMLAPRSFFTHVRAAELAKLRADRNLTLKHLLIAQELSPNNTMVLVLLSRYHFSIWDFRRGFHYLRLRFAAECQKIKKEDEYTLASSR